MERSIPAVPTDVANESDCMHLGVVTRRGGGWVIGPDMVGVAGIRVHLLVSSFDRETVEESAGSEARGWPSTIWGVVAREAVVESGPGGKFDLPSLLHHEACAIITEPREGLTSGFSVVRGLDMERGAVVVVGPSEHILGQVLPTDDPADTCVRIGCHELGRPQLIAWRELDGDRNFRVPASTRAPRLFTLRCTDGALWRAIGAERDDTKNWRVGIPRVERTEVHGDLRDLSGAPIVNAPVTCQATSDQGWSWSREVKTGADGKWRVTRVPVGCNLRVWADSPRGPAAAWEGSAGASEGVAPVALRGGGECVVKVLVRSAGGQAASGAQVALVYEGTPRVRIASASGIATFPGVPSGCWVSVAADDPDESPRPPRTDVLEFRSGNDVTQWKQISMGPGLTWQVTVRDRSGGPVAGACVQAAPANWRSLTGFQGLVPLTSRVHMTDERGTAIVPCIAGRTALHVWHAQIGATRVVADRPARDGEAIDIALHEPRRISGRLIDSGGHPLPFVELMLTSRSGDDRCFATTGEGGDFDFQCRFAGDLRLDMLQEPRRPIHDVRLDVPYMSGSGAVDLGSVEAEDVGWFVEGWCETAAGRALPDVSVSAWAPDGSRLVSTRADSYGRYVLWGVVSPSRGDVVRPPPSEVIVRTPGSPDVRVPVCGPPVRIVSSQ